MLKEYKRSLKEVEAEDTINIFIYRPLAPILCGFKITNSYINDGETRKNGRTKKTAKDIA